jgi:hypothetical protein
MSLFTRSLAAATLALATTAAFAQATVGQPAPGFSVQDTDGKVGKAYGARTTPHLYVIDPAGKRVFAGGIDSKPSSNPVDIASATNHVKLALAGKPVATPLTRPCGCSVKYASM